MEAIEYFVIGSLILIQLYLAGRLWYQINIYKTVYDKFPNVKQQFLPTALLEKGNFNENLKKFSEADIDQYNYKELTEITYLKNNSANPVFKVMNTQLNNYLINNRNGSVDFHIIKDIVNRNTDVIENDINNRIPAPLYVGLAATMIGIIIGLFSIHFGGKDVQALNEIQPLINGVKIAMSASVIGLIITTIFSVKIFKDAYLKVEEEKNKFLSQLQSELLPRMNNATLPEVEVLSQKLDYFARTTSDTIARFTKIVETSSGSIQREQLLLDSIKGLNVKEITSQNLKVFNRIEEMMDSFKSFAKYYDKLNKSMGNTVDLLQNLKEFVRSSQRIDFVLEDIEKTIHQGNDATEFFNKHIKSFIEYDESVNNVVAATESKIDDSMVKLNMTTQEIIKNFDTVISDYDSRMSEAFNKSIERFSETMNEQVIRTEEAFENSKPKFDKLDKLDKLENIEERLLNLENSLSNTFTVNSDKIVNALNNISPSDRPVKFHDKNKSGNDIDDVNKIIDYTLTGLKVFTYITIISYGIHSALLYFNIL